MFVKTADSMPMLKDSQRDFRVAATHDVLKRLRRDAGWTLEQFGDRIDMDRNQVSMLENDDRMPRWETLARVAAGHGMTYAELALRIEIRALELGGEPPDPDLDAMFAALKVRSRKRRRKG